MAAGLEAIERILEQQGQQAWEQADEFDEFVSEADEDVTHERTSYRPSPAPSHRTPPYTHTNVLPLLFPQRCGPP